MSTTELKGRVTAIRHSNPDDGYVVFTMEGEDGSAKVVGRSKGLAVGDVVTARGAWGVHTFGGRQQPQFDAATVEAARPAPSGGSAGGSGAAAPSAARAALTAVGAAQGHTAVPRARLTDAVAMTGGLDAEAAARAVDDLVASGAAVARVVDGVPHVAERSLDRAESEIATAVLRLARGSAPFDRRRAAAAVARASKAVGLSPTPSQAAALEAAMASRVSVVTGGPGVGKTTVMSILVRAAEALGARVALAALAGQAADRMREATGRPARTIHLMLEADGDGLFRRNASRPVEADLVIVDECSMVDVETAAALMAALAPGASLVLVGDPDQLRPVGAGRFFLDVIESGAVPVSRLTENRRQAAGSLVARNAERIRRGEMPEAGRSGEGADYLEVRTGSAAETRDEVRRLLAEALPRLGYAAADVAVITPQLAGDSGTQSLNATLREALNADASGAFAAGDRVMATRNDRSRRVMNGNVGTVTAVRPRGVTVEIDGREVDFDRKAMSDLVPAYAVTVHKMQGSERRCAIVVVSNEHASMLDRSLLMTAVTRARELAIVVCQGDALRRAVTTAPRVRSTTLRARIAARMAEAA